MTKAEEERKKVLEEEKKLQKAAQEEKVRERERKDAARMKAEEVEKKAAEGVERAGLHRELALVAKALRGLRLMALAHEIGMGRAADWHRQRILGIGLNNLVVELQDRWKDKRRAVLEREEQADFDYLKNAKR